MRGEIPKEGDDGETGADSVKLSAVSSGPTFVLSERILARGAAVGCSQDPGKEALVLCPSAVREKFKSHEAKRERGADLHDC